MAQQKSEDRVLVACREHSVSHYLVPSSPRTSPTR